MTDASSVTQSVKRKHGRLALLLAICIGIAGCAVIALLRVNLAAPAYQWLVPGLSIEGGQGWLLGDWTAQRIRLERADSLLEIDSVAVQIKDWRIFAPALGFTSLRADRARYVNRRPSSAPSGPPTSLGLPLSITLDEVTLASLEVSDAGKPPHLTLRNLVFKGSADGQRLYIDHAAAEHSTLKATLQGDLDLQPPFALKSGFSAQGKQGTHAWTVSGTAGGTLTELALTADAQSDQSRAKALLTLGPWQPQPLQKIDLELSDIDLRHWVAQAPHTRLQGSVRLKPIQDHFAGTVRLINASTGSWAAEQVPIRSLSGELKAWPDGRAQWEGLLLAFASSGEARGNGSWNGKVLALKLALKDADVQSWHPDLVSTRLQGDISLQADAQRQQVTLDVQDARRARLALSGTVDVDAQGLQGTLALNGANLGSAEGELRVAAAAWSAALPTGTTASTGSQITFTGKVARFNLAALGKLPDSRLQGDVNFAGDLRPAKRGRLQMNLKDSTLSGRPFVAQGVVQVATPFQLTADVQANLAGNLLKLNGSFGDPSRSLAWTLSAGNLATLGSAFAGSAEGSGTASGTLDAPVLQGELIARAIRLPGDVRIDAARLKGQGGGAREAMLMLDATLDHLRVGEREWVRKARLQVGGTGAQHRATLDAENGKWKLSTALEGGLGDGLAWAGQLTRLDAQGPLTAKLKQPASLIVTPGRQRIGTALFDVDGGELRLEVLDRTDTTIDSRGTLARYPVAALLPLLDPAIATTLDSTLRLKGSWDVNWVDIPNVKANIRRDDGDLVLRTTPVFKAGLTDVLLQLDSTREVMRAELRVQGTQLGEIAWQAALPIALRDGNLVISNTVPARGTARLNLPSIRWAGPWLGPAHDIDGTLSADLALEGIWPHLKPSGHLRGDKLSYAHLTEGVAFRNGILRARLDPGVLALETFRIQGGTGFFTASGRLLMNENDPTVGLEWKAESLHVLNLDERSIVASGEGKVEMIKGQMSLTGQLRADRGRIVLSDTSAPALSEDVVVRGRGRAMEGSTPARPVSLDLELNLGNDFHLTGRGLDVRLGGRMRMSALPGQPLVTTGTLRSRNDGTYRAYGQDLNIERAVLSFNGRMDNPSLDILAMRRGMSVEAGVALAGTADKPLLRLVSTPELPDGEKLSWLVLGRGSDGMDQNDKSAMLAAARTLLSQGAAANLAGSLASTLGVDAITLGTSSGSNTLTGNPDMVVTVGKRLSSRASIAYEQGLSGATSLIKLSYQLSRRWRVQLVTGTENAVDVFYRLAFD